MMGSLKNTKQFISNNETYLFYLVSQKIIFFLKNSILQLKWICFKTYTNYEDFKKYLNEQVIFNHLWQTEQDVKFLLNRLDKLIVWLHILSTLEKMKTLEILHDQKFFFHFNLNSFHSIKFQLNFISNLTKFTCK